MMITLKQWMETVDYRVTEGSDYLWSCYGTNAYILSSWNGIHGQGGYSFDITFDIKTQAVYEATAHDYKFNRAYRIINPLYVKQHQDEAKERAIEIDTAWDLDDGIPIKYVDLETVEDYLDKCQSIRTGLDYDTRVEMPLDIPDSDLLQYMKAAHRLDITFNQFIERALRELIEKHYVSQNQ